MSGAVASSDYALALLGGAWAEPSNRLPLVLGAAGVLLLIFWRPAGRGQVRRAERKAERAIRRRRNTRLWRRLWWTVRPPHDLMRVDGLVIERTGDKSHCLWPGPTGRGKSQSVATVRCNGERVFLAITPDLTDPIAARADFIWTAAESLQPIDFLLGTPADVAERLTTIFRSGGNGVWMMAAREATTQVVQALDARGEPRTLALIADDLEQMIESDRRLKTACEGWLTRFRSTAMALGPSAGHGGMDLAELLREGKSVLIQNDRWRHPGLCGDVVAFGLAEARRIADLVPGGYRLIFEEADQLAERIDMADPFFAAGRRRLVAVDALLHAKGDASRPMLTNSATTVYFRPNEPDERKKVAAALDLSESEVDEMPDWHAWIEHAGKIRRRVHFPKPKDAPSPVTEGIPANGQVDGLQVEHAIEVYEWPHQGTGEPVEYREWTGLRMLPPPGVRLKKLVDGSYRASCGCLRWKAELRHDRDGYGEVWIDGEGKYLRVHRLAWELVYGAIPRNPDGTSQTIDHIRGVCCCKDCFELTHLRLLSRAENSRDSQSGRGRMNRQARRARPRGSGGKGKRVA